MTEKHHFENPFRSYNEVCRTFLIFSKKQNPILAWNHILEILFLRTFSQARLTVTQAKIARDNEGLSKKQYNTSRFNSHFL